MNDVKVVVAEIHVDETEEGLVVLCALGETPHRVLVQAEGLEIWVVPEKGQVHVGNVVQGE